MNENMFYFPYSSETINKPGEFSIDRANEKSKTSNSASQNNRKNKLSNSNTAKAAPSY